MAQTTPNMQLTVWNLLSDPYDSSQLAQNFVAIDQHDHSGSGKGAPIDGTSALINGSVTSAKLASPSVNTGNLVDQSVTTDKIADSTGSTDGVTTAKIATSAITNAKIADGTIRRAKLYSDDVNVPLYVHASTNGSLPTTTKSGDALYDGYTIDYTDNSAASSRKYLWRLRYNGSSWDYVGGSGYRTTTSSTLTSSGNGPLSGVMYTGWDGANFQSFLLPLKGKYFVVAGGSGEPESNYFATFKTALYLGGTSPSFQTGIAASASPLAGTTASTLSFGVIATLTSDGDQASSATVNSIVSCTSNASSGNRLRQLFGCGTKFQLSSDTRQTFTLTGNSQDLSIGNANEPVVSQALPDASGIDFNLRFQHMYVVPYSGLSNF